jgi:hypothetical protein
MFFVRPFACLPETSLANMVKSNSMGYGSNECVIPVGEKSGCDGESRKNNYLLDTSSRHV